MNATAAIPEVLHLTLHAHPTESMPQESSFVFGRPVQSFHPTAVQLSRPLGVSFEAAFQRLASLPRLYIEMDGSFVRVAPAGDPTWQIDGQLTDSPVGLMTVELKLTGRHADLSSIVRCLDWPQSPLLYHLVRHGVFVEHDPLVRLLASN